MTENFHRAGPILLSLLQEENNVYMAGRAFYNYMDDIDIIPEDEPAFTEVSLSQGGQGYNIIFCF